MSSKYYSVQNILATTIKVDRNIKIYPILFQKNKFGNNEYMIGWKKRGGHWYYDNKKPVEPNPKFINQYHPIDKKKYTGYRLHLPQSTQTFSVYLPNPFPVKWSKYNRIAPSIACFPGGRGIAGETVHDAAFRQLYEETGLDLQTEQSFANSIVSLSSKQFSGKYSTKKGEVKPWTYYAIYIEVNNLSSMVDAINDNFAFDRKHFYRQLMEASLDVESAAPVAPNFPATYPPEETDEEVEEGSVKGEDETEEVVEKDKPLPTLLTNKITTPPKVLDDELEMVSIVNNIKNVRELFSFVPLVQNWYKNIVYHAPHGSRR